MTTYRTRNFVVAAALAVVAGLLTTIYVAHGRGGSPAAERTTVYVAAADIAAGTPGEQALAARLVKPVEIDRETAVAGAIGRPLELRGVIASERIAAGEQVTRDRFVARSARGVLGDLRGRMRAIKVAGDPNQLLAGVARPGDRVDVLATVKGRDGRTAFGRIVLRNVLVLDAAKRGDGTVATAGASHSATLRLTDRQAQRLFFVTKSGDWALVLRPAYRAASSPDAIETAATLLGNVR